MLKKLLIAGALSSALVGCGNSHDYSGSFKIGKSQETSSGVACKPTNPEQTFVKILKNENTDQYTVILSSSLADTYPTKSISATLDENGRLQATFYREGESGVLIDSPTVNMSLTMSAVDESHLLLERWDVDFEKSGISVKADEVKAAVFDMAGVEKSVPLHSLASSKTLCLLKVAE